MRNIMEVILTARKMLDIDSVVQETKSEIVMDMEAVVCETQSDVAMDMNSVV